LILIVNIIFSISFPFFDKSELYLCSWLELGYSNFDEKYWLINDLFKAEKYLLTVALRCKIYDPMSLD
jgi:hypothetical protein